MNSLRRQTTVLVVVHEEGGRGVCGGLLGVGRNKVSHRPPSGLLQPLPVAHRPWSDISLDFVTGLPSSEGNTTVLTVVDRFSKMVHFIPMPKLPSAKGTAEAVFVPIHGFPRDVVSDRGP